MPEQHSLLRHLLATLAYRAAKSVRGAPPGFGDFKVSPVTRTPVEILAHMGDLMDLGLTASRDTPAYNVSHPRPWDDEVERFFAALTAWDAYLASGGPLGIPQEKMIQGPIADALTHTGQINLLRGAAGWPVRGESYAAAAIAIGQTGREQPPPPPGSEFD